MRLQETDLVIYPPLYDYYLTDFGKAEEHITPAEKEKSEISAADKKTNPPQLLLIKV